MGIGQRGLRVRESLHVQGTDSERTGLLGSLAQRVQERVRATIDALTQSHAQRLAAIVESSEDAIISLDLDGNVATWNRGAKNLYGYEADEIVGKSILTLVPPERHDEEREFLERVARGEHVEHYETVRLTKEARPVPVSLSFSPILDASGLVIGASKIARDVTARKRAETALAKRADEQEALYEFTDRLFRARSPGDVYEAALDAIIRALGCDRASILLFDDTGVMRFVAWRGLSEDYRRAVEGHSPWTRDAQDPAPVVIDDIDKTDLDPSLKATVQGEGIAALAFIPLMANGRLIGKFMAYDAVPHTFSDHDIDLALTIARQLGFAVERMRAEEARELLLQESRHRIKNTLATVRAIATQTWKRTPAQEREGFLARLHALAEAHDSLTTQNWDQASMRELVDRALRPFQPTQPQRLLRRGPDLAISANHSLLLSLCLHELATNAAKYGALSNGNGKLAVTWRVAGNSTDRRLTVRWREKDGPPVSPPQRKGFGSLLIETSFGGTGQGCFEFRPEGVTCSFEVPLDS
jgi:PAS domain S-box-containing protein